MCRTTIAVSQVDAVVLTNALVHGTTARQNVPLADQALHLAKRRGRTRVQTALDIELTEAPAPTELAA
ncbi:hypothetical protein HF259_23360 [Rhizobium leguminosarum]|uniref:hypothetical protein n=1 Tax=Rhizobium leguminosarum TaxID=384 RepID=UPI001C90C087|nr:hypothetical protein [Rhizobium leguminosarum]MBY2924341.1 hypothetical protein [Rhizobium leguminosarum]